MIPTDVLSFVLCRIRYCPSGSFVPISCPGNHLRRWIAIRLFPVLNIWKNLMDHWPSLVSSHPRFFPSTPRHDRILLQPCAHCCYRNSRIIRILRIVCLLTLYARFSKSCLFRTPGRIARRRSTRPIIRIDDIREMERNLALTRGRAKAPGLVWAS